MKYLHEIICILIAISSFLLATLPISTLQSYVPFLNSNEYEIWYSKSRLNTTEITKVYIDGILLKERNKKLDIHKKTNLKINYRNSGGNLNEIKEKEIAFDPYAYFNNKAKSTKLDEFVSSGNFYNVCLDDLI